jgi:hypothetical protein
MLLVLSATGCVEIRASSRQFLPPNSSQVTLQGSPRDATLRFLFLIKGMGAYLEPLPSRTDESRLLAFRINRYNQSIKTTTGNIVSYTDVESILYVRMTPGDGVTQVEMLGKPTYNSFIVCSDEDDAWALKCDPLFAESFSSLRKRMTGKEEALFIEAILRELQRSPKTGPGSVVNSPAPPPAASVDARP